MKVEHTGGNLFSHDLEVAFECAGEVAERFAQVTPAHSGQIGGRVPETREFEIDQPSDLVAFV